MNKLFLTSMTVLMILGFEIQADYDSPPQWEGQTAYTHQSWDFGDDGEYGTPSMITSGLPLGGVPEGEPNMINSYGDPMLDSFYNSHIYMKGWMYVPESIQTGRVAMYGGMGDTSVGFNVPSVATGSDLIRQLWVQTIVYARKDGGQVASVEIARDAAYTDIDEIKKVSETVDMLDETEGYSALWYRYTSVYEVAEGGDNDYIKVWAYFDPELPDPERLGASMIDRVDIDTRFVLKADLNRSGVVNYQDFSEIAEKWATADAGADFDGNGIVGEEDIKYFSTMWLGSN